ncbi:hypothetical protein [Chamaesiphon minutus]|uniref:Uncharacterized protein n=1 Tax=Chamaesiphon minutus (strain ATCC 27169 / PCC 6605) TaxID=1173020 RepID=K9UMP1_CHAP6|nr:hypothetical protein [Chamaesiphon minutus]AFY96090.1 hypothetical protein Cha6605_5196 [Chamaesiphon minutus PCC 6605]
MSLSESSRSSQPSIDKHPNREICHYSNLLRQSIREQFRTVTQDRQGKVNLFTTATTELFSIFLSAMPPDFRQNHTCNSCWQFVARYGGIVTIDPDGKTTPVMWNPKLVPEVYAPAVGKLASVVAEAAIDNVFLSDLQTWGTPVTGIWEHFSVVPGEDLVFKSTPIYSTYQTLAQKRQEYQMLVRGLADFSLQVATQAYSLLSNAQLYRSEACLGIAKWFLDLQQQRQSVRNSRLRENLTWLAVANAPPGYCHIRSGMIGTLLEDIQNELTFQQIADRFNAKMNPLQYLRPQAPPKAGNIAQAEKIVAQLQTAGALDRRFAKLEDLQALWMPHPTAPKVESKGIFGHLQTATTKAQQQIDLPSIVMTWEKFARTILPTAKTIEYFVPASQQAYMALVTATNPEAPPIIQWDMLEDRNPVTWYFYANGSSPNAWNLRSNTYCPVTAIVLQPSLWKDAEKFAHKGEKAFLLLQNAKDKQYQKGAGFFPESLKSEYHSIRSTMEAYAQNAVLAGKDEATACGIGLQKGGTWDLILLRVTTSDNLQVNYQLDRWD